MSLYGMMGGVRGLRAVATMRGQGRSRAVAEAPREGLPGPMRFSKLLARLETKVVPRRAPNTQRTYLHSLKRFRTFFVTKGRGPMAHEIRSGRVEAFLEWRETHRPDGTPVQRRLKARSLAKERATLHTVFEYGFRLEVVDKNPVAVTRKPSGDAREPVILSANGYEALLHACEGRSMLRMFVLLLGESGVRCESEGLWLRWIDLQFQKNELVIETVRKGIRSSPARSGSSP